jgi:hypothetical protein
MWQPRQTLANNSSPLISKNLRPWLYPGDAEDAALCAQAINDSSEAAADIVVAKAARGFGLACFICTTSLGSASLTWFQVFTTRSCSRVMASSDDRMAPSCHAGM